MTSKAKDDNDRAIDGTLVRDPADDAVPIRVEDGSSTRALRTVGVDDRADPTRNPHAEFALLADLLWTGTNAPGTISLGTVADLLPTADIFASAPHRAIYDAMLAVHAAGSPLDKAAVHAELVKAGTDRQAGGLRYLDELLAGASSTSEVKVRNLAGALHEAHIRRRLIAVANEIAESAKASKGRAFEAASAGLLSLGDVMKASAGDASYVDVKTVARAMIREVVDGQIGDVLSTGIETLDELTDGLHRREVTLVAARTSVGKTLLASQLAFTVARAKPEHAVLYITLEMPPIAFVRRLVSAWAGVNHKQLRRRQLNSEQNSRVVSAVTLFNNVRVFFCASQSQTLVDIIKIAQRLSAEQRQQGARIVLVVIDHVGIVKPSAESRKRTREQEVAEISRGLRYLSEEFDCHVLALVQIAREAERQSGAEKMPRLHHLRESGALENDADNVWILHRRRDERGLFVPNEPAILAVQKARNGELGVVELECEPQFARFKPWPVDGRDWKEKAYGQ